jgi:hypothetical protein
MLGKNFDTAATLRSHLIDQGGISVLFVKLIHLPTRTGRWGAWGAEPPEHLHFVLLRFNIQYFHTEMCYIDPLHFGIIWWQQLDHGSCMVYYIWRRMACAGMRRRPDLETGQNVFLTWHWHTSIIFHCSMFCLFREFPKEVIHVLHINLI